MRPIPEPCPQQISDSQPRSIPRRGMLKILGGIGFGSMVFQRALAAQAQDASEVTAEMIKQAEWVSGLEFTDEDRELMLSGVNDAIGDYQRIRQVDIDNAVPPAVHFNAVPAESAGDAETNTGVTPIDSAVADLPSSEQDLAFASVATLASLLKTRKVSSVELTKLYLKRLAQHDPVLRCVISLTEGSALKQAEQADREIAAGNYRGPLHGVPWGAKDLLAFPGYRTTWGATPYKNQTRPEKAAVIERLERAGAVLVAKTTVGALAWGDVWYDATTKNPWNTEQGSSGSSAGSASATSAGLVGFAIGTETLGSIVSPCTRCGVTGLRPTFGRVSRAGCMALSWSMDKIGPIARSAEDCALIFGSIHGRDPRDPSTVQRPFDWPPKRDPRTLRVGFVASEFDESRLEKIENERVRERVASTLAANRAVLDVLRKEGFKLTPIALPDKYPVDPLSFILTAEAAAAFDQLTRSGEDDTLVRQVKDAWPNVFRQGQLVPAVEYIRANRIRTLLMGEMQKLMADIDVYVCPSFGGSNLLLTNLTGHPQVCLPVGFGADDRTPQSVCFTGQLHGESNLLAVANAYQQATDHHLKRPPINVKPGESTSQA